MSKTKVYYSKFTFSLQKVEVIESKKLFSFLDTRVEPEAFCGVKKKKKKNYHRTIAPTLFNKDKQPIMQT